MKRLLLLTSFIALSAQAMEPAEVITVTLKDDISMSITADEHKMLCSLSKTYADITQDTQSVLGNTDVITLDNIVPDSFEFILNYLNELNEITHATVAEQDIPAFNRLEKAFQKLPKDEQKSVKQVVTYLDLPTYLHPGLPPEMNEAINTQVFKDRSAWPLIDSISNQIVSKTVKIFSYPYDLINSASIKFTKDKLIFGSSANTIRIEDLNTGQWEKMLRGHTGRIDSITVVGNKIISLSGEDATIRVWNLDTGECGPIIFLERYYSGGIRLIKDAAGKDKILSTCSGDNTIRVWDLETGKWEKTLRGHTGYIRVKKVVVGKDNKIKIITGSNDKTIRVWDLDTSKCEHVLPGYVPRADFTVAFGKDKKMKIILESDNYNVIKVWDIETGQCEHTLTGHAHWRSPVVVVGDKIISLSGDDKAINIWDLDTGECTHRLSGHTGKIDSTTVVGNKIISVSGDDKTTRIWDLDTGKCEQILNDTHWRFRFARKNKIIFVSDDKTIRIWDIETGQCVQTLRGDIERIQSAFAFGNKIISLSHKTIRVWDRSPLKGLERKLYSLPVRDVAILTILQDEIVKDKEGQLKEDLCDKDGLNPPEKAKRLGGSPVLIQWLEETNLFNERKSLLSSYCTVQ